MIAAEAKAVAATEPAQAELASSAPLPKAVARDLVRGTSALGAGLIVERGLGFLANVLAARLGGAATFGAYSLALSTANNISSYAAGGIGSTAVRFSGRYARDTPEYANLSRALTIVALVSSALAMLALWAGTGPISRLLGRPDLAGLLHWSALSAAGVILLECCRGFLVGQRNVRAILLLSLTVGLGLLSLLPLTARFGPVFMIASQGLVTLGAVALCVLLYRQLGLSSRAQSSAAPLAPLLKEVWSFGLVQLAGLVGMNAAGWWLTTTVARADHTLVQMGFLAVSHQLRNMVGLFPGLLSESSLAVMAQGEGRPEKTPDQVMAVCTFATTWTSLLVATLGMIVAPCAIQALYGRSYAAASAAVSVALATAVVHMGVSPAAARLSILSIRTTGVINTVWAVLVAGGATLLFVNGGNAWQGATVYLVAHLLSALLVLLYLGRKSSAPAAMNRVFTIGSVTGIVLAGMSLWRSQSPELTGSITTAMTVLGSVAILFLARQGRQRGWMPSYRLLWRSLRNRWLSRSATGVKATDGGFDA